MPSLAAEMPAFRYHLLLPVTLGTQRTKDPGDKVARAVDRTGSACLVMLSLAQHSLTNRQMVQKMCSPKPAEYAYDYQGAVAVSKKGHK